MKTLSLYSFLSLIFILLVVSRIIPSGFHPDSLVYMSMAADLASGNSSFWHLHFTDTLFNEFYEHPPLGIFTMALPFYIFGDTLLIDKLYGIAVTIAIAFLTFKTLSLFYTEKKHYVTLLTLFYFLAFPIVSNTIENNLLELPATLFILLSVYIYLKHIIQKTSTIMATLLFSLSLFAAFLVKGPVTLFPLALPFFYYALFSSKYRFSQLVGFYLLMMLFIFAIAFLTTLYPDAHTYLVNYFHNQIVGSISGERGGDEHFKITSQLLVDLSVITLVSLFALFLGRVPLRKIEFSKYSYLFLLIGLSGSIPLEISPRQHDYYVFPSLIFFAIFLGTLFISPIQELLQKIRFTKSVVPINLLLTLGVVIMIVMQSNTVSRYKNFYHDIETTTTTIVPKSKVFPCAMNNRDKHEFYGEIGLRANLKRYYNVEFSQNIENANYLLTTPNSLQECNVNLKHYKYIGAKEAKEFLLYEKI